jgi:hypothetical protein
MGPNHPFTSEASLALRISSTPLKLLNKLKKIQLPKKTQIPKDPTHRKILKNPKKMEYKMN